MILVDTSIWIPAMLQANTELAKTMHRLIEKDLVVGHDFVHGELMLGKGGKTRAEVIELYAVLMRLDVMRHEAVVSFAKKHKLDGRGIGWVDVHLLAASSTCGALLWTGDKALDAAAGEIGMRFDPTRDAPP